MADTMDRVYDDHEPIIFTRNSQQAWEYYLFWEKTGARLRQQPVAEVDMNSPGPNACTKPSRDAASA